jgi:hypothetical protein
MNFERNPPQDFCAILRQNFSGKMAPLVHISPIFRKNDQKKRPKTATAHWSLELGIWNLSDFLPSKEG